MHISYYNTIVIEKTIKLWKIGHRRENVFNEPEAIDESEGGGEHMSHGEYNREEARKKYGHVKSIRDLRLPRLGTVFEIPLRLNLEMRVTQLMGKQPQ